MAEIIPFRGVRYAPQRIPDVARVVTPPYDVIGKEAQERYYAASEYNVIRLILGKDEEGDDERRNRYTRAAELWRRWREEGVLLRDRVPAVYVYEQEYALPEGERRRRRGFIALLKLVELDRGVVLPHEKTLSGPKQDRLRLMRACQANFSQIFALYADPARRGEVVLEEAVQKLPPLYDFADEEGVAHRLWAVEDARAIGTLQELLREKPVYIADGHHRYETALLYREERRRQEGAAAGPQPYDYVMMMFVNLHGEGLTIFPTHRLLKGLADLEPDEFLAQAEECFRRQVLPFSAGEEGLAEAVAAFLRELSREGAKAPSLGVYAGGEEIHLLSLRGHQVLEAELPHLAPALRELDVTVLHALLLERILGITEEEQREQKFITYTRDAVGAVQEVREGRSQLAFLLNPTRVEQVKAVAEAGETMPQKSTYFYPKLITGLVMNSLEGWEE